MEMSDADALLKVLVGRSSSFQVTLRVNNGRGAFGVTGPIRVERSSLRRGVTLYTSSEGTQFTAEQLVSIKVEGRTDRGNW